MSNGVLLFAFNNKNVDYIKQAVFCAKRIKEYLGLDVQLVTDNSDYLEETFPFYSKYIDIVTLQQRPQDRNVKKFSDGLYYSKKLLWLNSNRHTAYDISEFDNTLVIDTDYIISNDNLLKCFTQNKDFMIAKNYQILSQNEIKFDRVSDTSMPMYWATIMFFKKTEESKLVFDLVKHIQDNYSFYRMRYNISEAKFRNDYAFSIAIHMLNNFNTSSWPSIIPDVMWVATDKDVLLDIDKEQIKLLTHRKYDYIPTKISNSNIHIMNKFSLNNFINGVFDNE